MARQFGMKQPIPIPPNDHKSFHAIELKPVNHNWIEHHMEWIQMWNNRANFMVQFDPATEPLHFHSEYMEWYRACTRRWISYTGGAIGSAVSAKTCNLIHIFF